MQRDNAPSDAEFLFIGGYFDGLRSHVKPYNGEDVIMDCPPEFELPSGCCGCGEPTKQQPMRRERYVVLAIKALGCRVNVAVEHSMGPYTALETLLDGYKSTKALPDTGVEFCGHRVLLEPGDRSDDQQCADELGRRIRQLGDNV